MARCKECAGLRQQVAALRAALEAQQSGQTYSLREVNTPRGMRFVRDHGEQPEPRHVSVISGGTIAQDV